MFKVKLTIRDTRCVVDVQTYDSREGLTSTRSILDYNIYLNAQLLTGVCVSR